MADVVAAAGITEEMLVKYYGPLNKKEKASLTLQVQATLSQPIIRMFRITRMVTTTRKREMRMAMETRMGTTTLTNHFVRIVRDMMRNV